MFACFSATVPYTTTMFLCYQLTYELSRHQQFGLCTGLMQGILAASAAQLLTFPFDTIKKKMQVYMLGFFFSCSYNPNMLLRF